MKIKMTEVFQGTGQPTLVEGQEVESNDIGLELCKWLVEHGKAVEVKPPAKKPTRARKTTKSPRGRSKKNEND